MSSAIQFVVSLFGHQPASQWIERFIASPVSQWINQSVAPVFGQLVFQAVIHWLVGQSVITLQAEATFSRYELACEK